MQTTSRNPWVWFFALPTPLALAGDDKEIRLTIFNSDLALIERTRPMSPSAGLQRVEFKGISAKIIPSVGIPPAPLRK